MLLGITSPSGVVRRFGGGMDRLRGWPEGLLEPRRRHLVDEVDLERLGPALPLPSHAVSLAEHVGLHIAEPDAVWRLPYHGGAGFDWRA